MTDLRKRITQDTFLINTLLLSLLVMALALQVLIVVVWVFSFIPIKPSPLFATLFVRHQALVILKRDIPFYHFFIITACVLMGAGMTILKSRMSRRMLVSQLLAFTVAEYGLTFLIVFAVFKMFVYDFAPWTKAIFYMSVGISVLSKIFWNEIAGFYVNIKTRPWWDLTFVFLIFLIIFIPDIQALLAKTFITDHFIHFDGTIMSAAWAHLQGGILDKDQYSIYAIGLPVVIGSLAQLLGGFSYFSVMMVLVLGAVIYYIGVYALARFWLKSIPVAMAMVILLIKWQMFHPEVAPVVFSYPSITIWRYPLDIIFLFLLLSHLRHADMRLLAGAGVICGFSSFYMIDTGVYMSVAYGFYVVFAFIMDFQNGSWRETRIRILKATGMLLIVPVTTLGCLWLTQGYYLFTAAFWKELSNRATFFLIGYGDLPMYKSIVEGKYLDSWMGFFIPWVYTLVLIVTSTLLFLRKISREYLFIATLSVYGLGLYHYYACRSANTSYYVVVLPFVFILGCTLNWILAQHTLRKPILGSVLAVTFFALFTNHYFLVYPNLLNLSRNPHTHPIISMKVADGLSFFNHNDMQWPEQMKLSTNSLGGTDEELKTEKDFDNDGQLKNYFSREFDFSQDTALITRLTGNDQKVPLISSFETKILMQARRRPFFYYFPLVDSRPMHMRMFDLTELWTIDRLKRTLQQLQDAKPPYIFMEKILLAQSVPQYYEYLYPDLLVILSYIHQEYVPDEQGHYLIAMKRKGML
jgi:hypothetical protein